MRVIIVGSGGREHALAWKLARSPLVDKLFVATGNGGTATIAQNIQISATDIPALVAFAKKEKIDLTIVGPEAPLVAGLVDAFSDAELRAFGPTAAAARLEGSKAFAKRFLVEEGIPTGAAEIFTDYTAARAYLQRQELPVVVKASGLAAGKGVIICSTLEDAETALRRIMVERVFREAGDEVLIEECLVGEEASLLCFSDGRTVIPMLPARDYKRVGDGDAGLNTGGMGGYAPSPYLSPALVTEMITNIVQPTIDGMRRRGTPYVGVLYTGLMLTAEGPRVLEFNCRFGDPETQVLMPLLESDLMEIFLACLEGTLDEIALRWSSEHSVCLVMASQGYPGSYEVGKEITGISAADNLPNVTVFQAGTHRAAERLVTAGGRVLAVTATAPHLAAARERAYIALEKIHFAGAHYRRDIAAHAPPAELSAYAAAGVDIEAKDRAFKQMRAAVQATYTPAVLQGIGAFGGLFALDELRQVQNPVLVSSTDGVGTKTMLAAAMGRYDTIGHDIVNHCINDILVQGAQPLFFLDYIAAGKLAPDQVVALVESCAAACRAVGCVLIGGETAEMPGVYRPGAFDLVGTMIGWVARAAIVDGSTVHPGDVCVGLPSSGLHTNGYSLARRVFADVPWETILPELGKSVGEVLLTPHRAYLREIEAIWDAGVHIKAMAHITGGGFAGNIPRVLPPNIGVQLDRAAWAPPTIFRLIQERGDVAEMEMYRVFNMGIGMVLIVDKEETTRVQEALLGEGIIIGQAVAWDNHKPQVLL